MSTDLASFLAPGSLLGGVTQSIMEFLSVQDLLQYVASSATDDVSSPERPSNLAAAAAPASPRTKSSHLLEPSAGGHNGYRHEDCSSSADSRSQDVAGRGGGSDQGDRPDASSWEEEIPQGPGAGDEAGGVTRTLKPLGSAHYDHSATDAPPLERRGGGAVASSSSDGNVGGGDRRYERHKQQHQHRQARGKGTAAGGGGRSSEKRREEEQGGKQEEHGQSGFGVFGVILGLGLQPFAALGVIGGGVSHAVFHLLGRVPLLALLRWAAGGAEMVLGVTFRVALLPYDVTRGVISYVVGTLEAMLNVATEVRLVYHTMTLCSTTGNLGGKVLLRIGK